MILSSSSRAGVAAGAALLLAAGCSSLGLYPRDAALK